jgi:predicted Zn-dependent protease
MNSLTRKACAQLLLVGVTVCGTLDAAAEQDVRRRAHATNNNEFETGDVKAEIAFGRELAARILGREALHNNAELTRYVALIGQALASNSGRSELPFYFAVLDSEQVNAYSTPGGYVFVTRGALKKMHDEAELAAVLAHEIAHVQLRHIVNAMHIRGKETNGAMTWMSVITGGSGDTAKVAFFQAVDQATTFLFEEGFNIRDELASDRVALMLLANTGYDPEALSRFLTRIDRSAGVPPAATPAAPAARNDQRTHPSGAERLTALATALRTQGLTDLKLPRRPERFASYATHY